jgi:hypothetical protein
VTKEIKLAGGGEVPRRYDTRHLDAALFPHEHIYFFDTGSVLRFGTSEYDEQIDAIVQCLAQLDELCRADWHWYVKLENIFVPNDPWHKITDRRRYLWINFASADDAMLCRLSILELRKIADANCGGLPS